jgi:hypothetical protein
MARQLAATLDGMSRSMAARMVGQTSGQLLKVLDKLGVPRGPPVPAVHVEDGASPPSVEKPMTDAAWYPGFEDDLDRERIAWVVQRHAERSGGRLPVPGTEAYSRNPWAPDVPEQSGPEARARRRAEWRWMSGGLPVSVAGESRPDR